jgi:hypothetical protein
VKLNQQDLASTRIVALMDKLFAIDAPGARGEDGSRRALGIQPVVFDFALRNPQVSL